MAITTCGQRPPVIYYTSTVTALFIVLRSCLLKIRVPVAGLLISPGKLSTRASEKQESVESDRDKKTPAMWLEKQTRPDSLAPRRRLHAGTSAAPSARDRRLQERPKHDRRAPRILAGELRRVGAEQPLKARLAREQPLLQCQLLVKLR